jgi:S-adenosylmethionine:tRNA ribosyltransferase-isomerase
MKLSEYDYYLPENYIAQYPLEKRDHSKLLVLNRKSGEIQHRNFYEVTEYLHPGDCLVINETKVFPARLIGKEEKTSEEVEIFLLRPVSNQHWEALVKPGKKLPVGSRVVFAEGRLTAEIKNRTEVGGRVVAFECRENFDRLVEEIGIVPLPPYVKRPPEEKDKKTYQTVYAKVKGGVAAPTAGFHFTEELLKRIKESGVEVVPMALHPSVGTFRPVTVPDPRKHRMEPEYYQISAESLKNILETRKRQGRIIAVGTTVVRALETISDQKDFSEERNLRGMSGWTNKFIYPPYDFKLTDLLLTNFHLPKSTLLFLVSAFATRKMIFSAYREAIERKYRFYSYGDAMFIL